MKILSFVLFFFTLFGCQSDKAEDGKFYMAVKGEDTALLRIIETEDRFWGEFEIRYGGSVIKDSGGIRGVIIGDTLKGKYNYLSYGGSKVWKPFVILRNGKNFKFGSGVATTYMNIPFYLPESIAFKKSDFLFQPIDSILAKKLVFKTN